MKDLKPNRPEYLNLLPVFWMGCAIYILGLVVIRYFAFPKDHAFLIPMIFFTVICLNVFESERIIRYLKKHYDAIWRGLTYFPSFGTYGRDSFRFIKFVFGFIPSVDKNVESVRISYQNVVAISFLLIIAFVVLFSSVKW